MKKTKFSIKRALIFFIVNLMLITVLYTGLLANSFAYNSGNAISLTGIESILNIESVQCKGVTKKGSRCKRKTNNSNGYCWQHQDQAPKK